MSKGSTLPKPLYTTFDSVKVRLTQKIQFQKDCENLQEGELPDAFLAQLIGDAETAVEQELRGRYSIPFQSIGTSRWEDLPDHTKRAIRRVVDFRSVMEVLRSDFGRGTHVDGEKYYDPVQIEYNREIKILLGQDSEGKERNRFRFTPPLDGLKLAKTNIADDGYKGMIINTDMDENDAVTYAKDHINDPSKGITIRRRRL